MRRNLLLMRARGLWGSNFGKHANHTHTLSKSAGTQVALGISAVPALALITAAVSTEFTSAIEVKMSKDVLFYDGANQCDPKAQFAVTGSVSGVHVVDEVFKNPNDFHLFAISTTTDFAVGETVTVDYVDGVCKIESLHEEILPTDSYNAINILTVCSFGMFGHYGDLWLDTKPWVDTCNAFIG